MTPDDLAEMEEHAAQCSGMFVAFTVILAEEVKRCWAKLYPHAPTMTMTSNRVYCSFCLEDDQERLRTGYCAVRVPGGKAT